MAANVYHSQSDRLKEIKNTLWSVLDTYRENPEKIAEMLEFSSKFYNYSLNNSILISKQNPYSTYVASFQDWKDKGYHVKKGQHGIKVLYPIRTELIEIGNENGKKKYRRVADATPEEKRKIRSGELKPVKFTRFGVGTVFDISQTDCPQQDYPKIFDMGYSSAQHAELYNAVKNFIESKKIPVTETDLTSISLRGAFYPDENAIRISDKLNDTEKLSTLTHELGHALMHGGKDAFKKPAEIQEFEADCVSIMLQKYFGVGLTDSRKKHFADNYDKCRGAKDFKIEDVLKNVNKVYCNLRKELEPFLKQPEKIKPERQKNNDYEKQDAAELDYIKHNIPIVQLAKDMGFTPVKAGAYYSLKEHDSVRIYPETNSFCRFSAGAGGSPIDFLMHFGGYGKAEAIKKLKDEYIGDNYNTIKPVAAEEKKPSAPVEKKNFILPEKVDGKYSHMYAYLTKTRCIDAEIVRQCIKANLLYEDKHHNAVFVGKDGDKAEFATRHSTLTGSSFKRDVAGSRQDIGFMVNNNAEKLYVCEAPIDTLSIMSLMKQQGKQIEKASYLATCGTGKDAAVYTRLKENPQIKEVVLANDHDTAGFKANKKIYEHLCKDFPDIKVKMLSPKKGKDINDCLRQAVKKNKVQEVVR